jgi:hypothetical protein
MSDKTSVSAPRAQARIAGFLPRFLGVLLIIAGLFCLISTFMVLVFPVVALPLDTQVLSYIPEMALPL